MAERKANNVVTCRMYIMFQARGSMMVGTMFFESCKFAKVQGCHCDK